MTEGKALVERHGITVTQRAVYHYNGYKYDHLGDALNYAELVRSRGDELAAQTAGEKQRADRE